ncbi:unnamed protein product, partial [Iphiclides podalirius]
MLGGGGGGGGQVNGTNNSGILINIRSEDPKSPKTMGAYRRGVADVAEITPIAKCRSDAKFRKVRTLPERGTYVYDTRPRRAISNRDAAELRPARRLASNCQILEIRVRAAHVVAIGGGAMRNRAAPLVRARL